jgi:transposase
MAKSSFNHQFSSEEINLLQNYRDRQGDGRLKQRFIALLLLAEGASLNMILSVIGISEKSLERWLDTYIRKGINALNSFQYQAKAPLLEAEEQQHLLAWVESTTPGNLASIVEHIHSEFGVVYTTDAISKLLKRNGFKKKLQK